MNRRKKLQLKIKRIMLVAGYSLKQYNNLTKQFSNLAIQQ